jgi:spore coat polysaccharide biosynthesis protein SpsF
MNIVMIIQARMGSTRLPGKVLLPLEDRTVLGQVIARALAVPSITQVCVATTESPKDDAIADECKKYQVMCVRGSEDDVLSRYYKAAVATKADHIVRITSDCPLLDVDVTESIIQLHLTSGADFTSNCLKRQFPRGLDTEVFPMKVLREAHEEATSKFHREHVCPFLYQQEGRYRLEHYQYPIDYSHYRWTVDTPEDYKLISILYKKLYIPGQFISWQQGIELLENEPELALINANVEQKTQ